MGPTESERLRICVCYVITTVLIASFVYVLVYNNVQSYNQLQRLREEVDGLSHIILNSKTFDKNGGDSNYLTDLVDNLINKRLTGIWDDLYAIKKEIKTQDTPVVGGMSGSMSGSMSKLSKEKGIAEYRERVNYASAELGAKVVSVRAEPLCPPNFFSYLLGLVFSSNPPVRMLRSNMEPGSCFAYKNDKAEFTIKLPKEVLIDQVGVQHISKFQSPTEDVSSAPKDFSVCGVKDATSTLLGTFVYETKPEQLLQQFDIKTNEKYDNIKFNFLSNHGHPNYTCIYRITIYGKL